MTGSNATNPTPIDIRAEADRVIDLLGQGRIDEGVRLLDEVRMDAPLLVQEALDRYVLAGTRNVIGQAGLYQHASVDVAPAVLRLHAAGLAPRMPAHGIGEGGTNEFAGLTTAQEYDVYASIAAVRGTDVVATELGRNDHSMLLGLRRETPTWASGHGDGRAGTGVYDDRIIVLIRDEHGDRRVFVAHQASTEPTAQYDQRARPSGDAANLVYQGVTRPRPVQGEDVDGDGVRDLGRMAEGTFELVVTQHNNPQSAGTNAALRPSRRSLDAGLGTGLIQRDTNGDGYFTADDPNGVQDLNSTFKIHSGSRQNTDSAGCQTIHPDDYLALFSAVRSNQAQRFFQYVLTSTHDGRVRGLEVERDEPPLDGDPREEAGPRGDRQVIVPTMPQPFSDPGLNRYYAALMDGDAALADRIALGFESTLPQRVVQHAGEPRLETGEIAERRELTRDVPGMYI